MSVTTSNSDHICVPIPQQEAWPDIEKLPPGWKSNLALAGTGIVLSTMIAGTPVQVGMCCLETATGAATLVYGVYKTVSAGFAYATGNDSDKTYKQLKNGLTLTAIGGGVVALAQAQLVTFLNLAP